MFYGALVVKELTAEFCVLVVKNYYHLYLYKFCWFLFQVIYIYIYNYPLPLVIYYNSNNMLTLIWCDMLVPVYLLTHILYYIKLLGSKNILSTMYTFYWFLFQGRYIPLSFPFSLWQPSSFQTGVLLWYIFPYLLGDTQNTLRWIVGCMSCYYNLGVFKFQILISKVDLPLMLYMVEP